MSQIVTPASSATTGMAGLVVVDPVVAAALAAGVPAVAAIGALTDRSGTLAAGATSQAVAAANAARKYFFFENVSDTDMWINFGVAAVANQPSILVLANGGSFTMEGAFVSNQAVNVICATIGKAYTAKEA